MQVDPALPWDNTVEGGTIQLRDPLTLQQLLDGALDVMLKNGRGEVSRGYFLIYPSDNRLYITGDTLDYLIDNVDTSATSTPYSELILERVHHADETLYSVKLKETLLNGIYCAEYEGQSNYVFKVEGNTVKPLYGTKDSDQSRAGWWRIYQGSLSEFSNPLPFPQWSLGNIQSALNEFGGGSEKYQIDANGEQKTDLTINDINILSE